MLGASIGLLLFGSGLNVGNGSLPRTKARESRMPSGERISRSLGNDNVQSF
jgi:hypothetical protein